MSCVATLSTLTLSALVGLTAAEAGIAAAFPGDLGLDRHPQVLFFEDFEKDGSPLLSDGRTIVAGASPVAGSRILASANVAGKHLPWDVHVPIAATETIFYRFYAKFDRGYEMGGGVKGPGVSAQKEGRPGGKAGIKPRGDDRFSARVCFDAQARPYLYYYHMDMGQWGSNAKQNLGEPISMQPERWYCLEMMLVPNAPTARDGELKLWIDGELKVHAQGIRWRTTEALKINWVNHSAYFGGDWTSPKDQIRFEDNLIAASAYIGPAAPKPAERKR